MKIIGVGTDILTIDRMAEKLENRAFSDGVFTDGEIEYINKSEKNRAARAAGIFCAKEACVKALGTGFCGIMPADVSISHDINGRPTAEIISKSGEYENFEINLSISHDGEYAVAFAVIQSK